MERTKRYHLAGVIYLIGAVLVLLITLSTPGLVTPQRYGALAQLSFGVPFIVLFAWLIYAGDLTLARLLRRRGWDEMRAQRWGAQFQDGLTMVLTLSSLGRLFVFAANSIGYDLQVHYLPPSIALLASAPQPLFVLNALLMLGILWAMIRAAWWPFLQRNVHFWRAMSGQKPRVALKRDLS